MRAGVAIQLEDQHLAPPDRITLKAFVYLDTIDELSPGAVCLADGVLEALDGQLIQWVRLLRSRSRSYTSARRRFPPSVATSGDPLRARRCLEPVAISAGPR